MLLPHMAKGPKLAQLFYDHYKAQGWSRAEAARRAGVTPGYLCSLFATGRLPHRDTLKGIVDGWGMNPVEIMVAAGYLTMEELEIEARLRQLPNIPDGLRDWAAEVMRMPERERKAYLTACQTIVTLATHRKALAGTRGARGA
jgi:transcriptional regulator with XRE-family HTH domain